MVTHAWNEETTAIEEIDNAVLEYLNENKNPLQVFVICPDESFTIAHVPKDAILDTLHDLVSGYIEVVRLRDNRH